MNLQRKQSHDSWESSRTVKREQSERFVSRLFKLHKLLSFLDDKKNWRKFDEAKCDEMNLD